jgi:hypothetical protein
VINEPAAETARPETVRQETQHRATEEPARGTAEESPNFFDERFDFSEPFDVLESGEPSQIPVASTESAGSAASTGEEEKADESRPRRRRRRRRGRSRDSEPRDLRQSSASATDESVEQAETTERAPADLSAVTEAFESAVRAEPAAQTEPASEYGEKSERRSKRRRPHRKRRDRDAEGEPQTHAKAATEDAGPAESAFDADEDDDAEALELSEHEGDEGTEEGRLARVGFRKIPAWEEVVGMIITKNLESRAKRPNGGAPRGRGGPRNQRGNGGGGRR